MVFRFQVLRLLLFFPRNIPRRDYDIWKLSRRYQQFHGLSLSFPSAISHAVTGWAVVALATLGVRTCSRS